MIIRGLGILQAELTMETEQIYDQFTSIMLYRIQSMLLNVEAAISKVVVKKSCSFVTPS